MIYGAASVNHLAMIYVLAYPEFEPNVAKRIRQFRIANEPARADLVPPHVTLVFGLEKTSPRELIALCEGVADASSRFDVDFASAEAAYDPYEKAHKLFLIVSAGSARLTALHQQLCNGPRRAEPSVDAAYRPHMTVATNDDRTIIEHLDVAALGSFPLLGTVRALEIVKLSDGKLCNLRTIPFLK